MGGGGGGLFSVSASLGGGGVFYFALRGHYSERVISVSGETLICNATSLVVEALALFFVFVRELWATLLVEVLVVAWASGCSVSVVYYIA